MGMKLPSDTPPTGVDTPPISIANKEIFPDPDVAVMPTTPAGKFSFIAPLTLLFVLCKYKKGVPLPVGILRDVMFTFANDMPYTNEPPETVIDCTLGVLSGCLFIMLNGATADASVKLCT